MEEILKDWEKNASKKEDRNFDYIRSLKMKDPDKVDELAKRLHEEAFSKIDCLKCGNCCKNSKPLLTQEDIAKIGENLQMTEKEVKTKYLEEDKGWIMNSLPCPFLNTDNSCRIYSFRPKDCQEFPHTNKKGFSSRSYQHSLNTTICPASYYIVERMQKIMR